MSKRPLGFIPEPLNLALDRILPSHKPPEGVLNSRKFKQITASIQAVGLIEPLSVGKPDRNSQHILLDGHMRLLALRKLGFADAPCLIATENESYTYNNRINRISTIQEHRMLRRAIERGVPAEKLAAALDVDISYIYRKASLLDGVCPEAVEMLKDRHFSPSLGSVLRKLKPTRQIECVELMLTVNNTTIAYAQALLAATPLHLLAGETKPRKIRGVTAEQMTKMEREMSSLQGQLKMVEQSYGRDVLTLVLARGYLGKLLDNKAAFRFLSKHQPEVLSQFENIVQTIALDGKSI